MCTRFQFLRLNVSVCTTCAYKFFLVAGIWCAHPYFTTSFIRCFCCQLLLLESYCWGMAGFFSSFCRCCFCCCFLARHFPFDNCNWSDAIDLNCMTYALWMGWWISVVVFFSFKSCTYWKYLLGRWIVFFSVKSLPKSNLIFFHLMSFQDHYIHCSSMQWVHLLRDSRCCCCFIWSSIVSNIPHSRTQQLFDATQKWDNKWKHWKRVDRDKISIANDNNVWHLYVVLTIANMLASRSWTCQRIVHTHDDAHTRTRTAIHRLLQWQHFRDAYVLDKHICRQQEKDKHISG